MNGAQIMPRSIITEQRRYIRPSAVIRIEVFTLHESLLLFVDFLSFGPGSNPPQLHLFCTNLLISALHFSRVSVYFRIF
jgi:hypothetical protein